MADNDDNASNSEMETGESSTRDGDEDRQLDAIRKIIHELSKTYESIQRLYNQEIHEYLDRLDAALEELKSIREKEAEELDDLLAGIAQLFKEEQIL